MAMGSSIIVTRGVDLSQFQYVDTTVSNPLHMRHGDMLGWIHNFLQVDPSWRCELYEMRNKCWRGFVHMAMNTMKFPFVVLVQQEQVSRSLLGR